MKDLAQLLQILKRMRLGPLTLLVIASITYLAESTEAGPTRNYSEWGYTQVGSRTSGPFNFIHLEADPRPHSGSGPHLLLSLRSTYARNILRPLGITQLIGGELEVPDVKTLMELIKISDLKFPIQPVIVEAGFQKPLEWIKLVSNGGGAMSNHPGAYLHDLNDHLPAYVSLPEELVHFFRARLKILIHLSESPFVAPLVRREIISLITGLGNKFERATTIISIALADFAKDPSQLESAVTRIQIAQLSLIGEAGNLYPGAFANNEAASPLHELNRIRTTIGVKSISDIAIRELRSNPEIDNLDQITIQKSQLKALALKQLSNLFGNLKDCSAELSQIKLAATKK